MEGLISSLSEYDKKELDAELNNLEELRPSLIESLIRKEDYTEDEKQTLFDFIREFATDENIVEDYNKDFLKMKKDFLEELGDIMQTFPDDDEQVEEITELLESKQQFIKTLQNKIEKI